VWAAQPPETVLDVCCGTGLMTAELIARGMAVVGIDASAEMLDRARSLLGPSARLERVVLPDLPIDGPFDAAGSTMDGLNYLELPDFRRTMLALSAVVRPGGWLVFDLHTDATLLFAMENPVIRGDADGTSFVLTTDLVGERTCRTTIELTAPDPADSFTETHEQYIHSEGDVRAALAEAGFAVVAVTDEYTPSPAAPTTLRASWIARRTPVPAS
jgi:SAM-dependent methyltransferase